MHGAALETVIIFTERMEELASFYQEALELGPFERSPNHMGCRVGPVYYHIFLNRIPATRNRAGRQRSRT